MKERVKAELTVTKIGTIFGSEEVSYYFDNTDSKDMLHEIDNVRF